jgi:hypothetical protein
MKPKFKGKPRTELIAGYAYGARKAALAPAPPPEEEEEAPEQADAVVTSSIEAAQAAVSKAIEAQEGDPDAADPEDEAVLEGLQSAASALESAASAQGTDSDEEEEEGHTAASAPGEIDPNSVCSNGSCGHPASAHETTDDGAHAGGCLVDGCECAQFASNEESNEDEPDDGEDDSASEPAKGAHSALAAGDEEPAEEEEPEPTKTKPPDVEGGELMGPAFTIPVAVIEGEPTGDGRQIALEALDWRDPPLPLMGMATGTHDPSGMSPQAPSVICGRIDTVERQPGPNPNTSVLVCKGYFLPGGEGTYFAELTESMGRVGVSADIAVEDVDMEITEVDDMGFPIEGEETLTKGTLMAVTIVPTPAFEGAYLVLGDGSEQPEPIPQSSEEAATAAGIHWMSYDECEPCAGDIDVLEASGGPTSPPAAWFADPKFTEGDGRLVEILDRRSSRVLGGKYACPLTVTDDGRVYGHLAPWGVCHSAFADRCVLAPKSKVGYAHFKRAQHIVTAEGEEVRVGVITMDAGHAPTRGIRAAAAMAHYDNTAWAIADVNIGEDEYGIWVAGALRPDATEEQVRKLRAASISGDWRNMGNGLELVAALAVNQPGYPLAQVAAGRHEAMVASGAGVMHALKHAAIDTGEGEGATLTRALMPLLEDARGRATTRIHERARASATARLARIRNH